MFCTDESIEHCQPVQYGHTKLPLLIHFAIGRFSAFDIKIHFAIGRFSAFNKKDFLHLI